MIRQGQVGLNYICHMINVPQTNMIKFKFKTMDSEIVLLAMEASPVSNNRRVSGELGLSQSSHLHELGSFGNFKCFYQGITLTSIVAKIYNTLLCNRIEPKIEKILKNQNGFWRNRSTTSQI